MEDVPSCSLFPSYQFLLAIYSPPLFSLSLSPLPLPLSLPLVPLLSDEHIALRCVPAAGSLASLLFSG